MPAEEYTRHDQQEITEEYSFDELARGMADGTLTRGRMLKLVGATALGGLLATGFPGIAEARRRRKKSKKRCNPATLKCAPAGP